MNLDNLTASIQRDPKLLAGGAAVVGVVGLALYRRRHAAAAGTSSPAAAGASLAGTAGIAGAPDTSATDLANGFQNQLNGLQTQLAGLVDASSAPAADNVPRYKRFVDAAIGGGQHGTVYRIENGSAIALTNAEWVALGQPAFDSVTTQDSDWALVHQAPALLPGSTPVRTVAPMAAAPKPALSAATVAPRLTAAAPASSATPTSYTIPAGGTLYGAAEHFYGPAAAPTMVQALAAHNGIRTQVRGGQVFASVRPGQQIVKA